MDSIPTPKSHLVKWSDFFASDSPCRSNIVLKPEETKAGPSKPTAQIRVPSRALVGPKCWLKSFISDREREETPLPNYVIKEFDTFFQVWDSSLWHLGIEHHPPARDPPRYQEESFEFGSAEDLLESMVTIDV